MVKKFNLVLIVLFSFFSYCLCGCVTKPPMGTIDVSSSPSGAEVYLDNQYKGTTPVIITDVPPGEHIIELRSNGYEKWTAKGTTVEGGSSIVQVSLKPISITTPLITPPQTPTFTPTTSAATPYHTTSPPVTTTGGAAVCDCSYDHYNCADFPTHAAAQACYNYCLAQGKGDIHRLDSDKDGSACESLS
jgi:hypothetical protein